MQIAARTGTMARRGAPLPYLRRVAYLESDGGQFIDLGFHGDFDIDFNVDFMRIGTGYQSIFGTSNWGDYGFSAAQNVGSGFRMYFFCGNEAYWNNPTSEDSRYSAIKVDDLITVNSYQKTLARSAFKTSQTVKLFRGVYTGATRIYRAEFTNVDGSTISLIPVISLTERPAMYDEVSGQLFYNQGTGEFTWGELET